MSNPRREELNLLYRLRQIPLGIRIYNMRMNKKRKEKKEKDGEADQSQFIDGDSSET